MDPNSLKELPPVSNLPLVTRTKEKAEENVDEILNEIEKDMGETQCKHSKPKTHCRVCKPSTKGEKKLVDWLNTTTPLQRHDRRC